jgi:P-type conjugative transfer protein TrbJ
MTCKSERTSLFSLANALSLSAVALAGLLFPSTPAQAIIVFDPGNYTQNVLTAARTLQQINNQIRSLQNQAQSLINQAKNLATISFPELQAITGTLAQINALMGQAQGIAYRVSDLDRQFRQFFPQSLNQTLSSTQLMLAARERLDTQMAAYKKTMTVQSQVVENVEADAQTLGGIVARSQDAQGALQAQQATNQLLALTAKQQFQIQNLLAAQSRAQAIDQATRAQAQTDARAATRKFLGSGSAYTPN